MSENNIPSLKPMIHSDTLDKIKNDTRLLLNVLEIDTFLDEYGQPYDYNRTNQEIILALINQIKARDLMLQRVQEKNPGIFGEEFKLIDNGIELLFENKGENQNG